MTTTPPRPGRGPADPPVGAAPPSGPPPRSAGPTGPGAHGPATPLPRVLEAGRHLLAGDHPEARRRLPARVVPCWRWALVAAVVPPVVLLVVVGLLLPTTLTWLAVVAWVLAGLLAAVGALAVVVVPPVRHAVFWYALSDTELDIGHGVVFRHRTVVPMSRVQSLRTDRGPLSRWYRLTTVRVGTAAGSVALDGLEPDDADRLCALISRLADVRDDV